MQCILSFAVFDRRTGLRPNAY